MRYSTQLLSTSLWLRVRRITWSSRIVQLQQEKKRPTLKCVTLIKQLYQCLVIVCLSSGAVNTYCVSKLGLPLFYRPNIVLSLQNNTKNKKLNFYMKQKIWKNDPPYYFEWVVRSCIHFHRHLRLVEALGVSSGIIVSCGSTGEHWELWEWLEVVAALGAKNHESQNNTKNKKLNFYIKQKIWKTIHLITLNGELEVVFIFIGLFGWWNHWE